MDDAARKRRATWIAGLILAVFVLLGAVLVLEVRSAQVGIWRSALSASDKYLWFSRLQTSKTIIALFTLILGLLGANFAWRSGQKPE